MRAGLNPGPPPARFDLCRRTKETKPNDRPRR